MNCSLHSYFFFFNATATTEIYTLSLHDALPITLPRSSGCTRTSRTRPRRCVRRSTWTSSGCSTMPRRSEEHTSELQSQFHLVCRLLLEKKKKQNIKY